MADFRALDVDQYDEDALRAMEFVDTDPRTDAELVQIAQGKQARVRSCMTSHDAAGALAAVLADAPSGAHAEGAKALTFATLLEILNATRAAEIPAVVTALDLSERDTLMHYLYKGLALGGTRAGVDAGVNCAVLLSWHEKVGPATDPAYARRGHRLDRTGDDRPSCTVD